jgi:hypothetical protein
MAYGDAPTSYFIVTYHNIPLSAFDPTAEGNQLEFNRRHCLSFHTAKQADDYLARIRVEGSQATRIKAVQKLHVSSRAKGWHNVPFRDDPVLLFTMDDVHKAITRCLSKGMPINWIGLLPDNCDISPDVMSLITANGSPTDRWYNWQSGNEKMIALVRKHIDAYLDKHPESYTLDFSFMYHYINPKRQWADTNKETL